MGKWIEIASIVLSALATIIATVKGTRKVLTAEEIETKAETKKQKYITKQFKKNKIALDNKSEDVSSDTAVVQNSNQNIKTY